MRIIPDSARQLIKEFEGLRLVAYPDAGGLLTIGYGHAINVKPNQTITLEQANAYVNEDMQEAAKAIDSLVTVSLTDNEYAALIDFVFNMGYRNFKNSTLLRLLNKGMYDQIPQQLMRWNMVNGLEYGGLTRRRKAEAELWKSRS